MIYKNKEIGLNKSVTMQAVSGPEQAQGNYGPQLKWDVVIAGQQYTYYTPVYSDGPDKIGRALQTGQPVTVTRRYDQQKQKAVLDVKVGGGVLVQGVVVPSAPGYPACPPPAPAVPAGLQQRPPVSPALNAANERNNLARSYLAILKAVAVPGESVEANHDRAVQGWELLENWIDEEMKRISDPVIQLVEQIKAQANATGLDLDDFVMWVETWATECHDTPPDLGAISYAHAKYLLDNWDQAMRQYKPVPEPSFGDDLPPFATPGSEEVPF